LVLDLAVVLIAFFCFLRRLFGVFRHEFDG
jgi:hypothetical protein